MRKVQDIKDYPFLVYTESARILGAVEVEFELKDNENENVLILKRNALVYGQPKKINMPYDVGASALFKKLMPSFGKITVIRTREIPLEFENYEKFLKNISLKGMK